MRLTDALLRHALSLRHADLSEQTRAATRMFVLDTLAVGAAGSGPQVALTEVIRRSAADYGRGDEARVWVTGERLPAASAAMVNGWQIHNQEFDCVHMAAVVHPMAVIASALFAAAQQRASREGALTDGKVLMSALNVAVDVAVLLGRCARGPMRFFRPAMCGALGAAAAIAHLHAADEELLRRMLGLTCSHLSGTMQAHVEGSPTLALQAAFNARAVLTCWELARGGFPAPREMLEGAFGYLPLYEGEFDTVPSLRALAEGEAQMEGISHKVFPTGGAAHAAQDMLMELRQCHDLTLDTVTAIEVQAPPLVRRLVGRVFAMEMDTSYARLCLPFLLGTVLLDGKVGLSAFSPERRADPRLVAFAPKVTLAPNACTDPNALAAQSMSVTLHDGRQLHSQRDVVIGSPERRLTRAQQLNKFHHCLDHAARPFDRARRHALIEMVDQLEHVDDVCQLIDLMMVPIP